MRQHAPNTVFHLTQQFTAIRICINSEQMWQSSDPEEHLSQVSVRFEIDYHYMNAAPIYHHQDSATDSLNESKITHVDIFVKTNI